MFFIQWEELCIAGDLLILCIVYHLATEGLCNSSHFFSRCSCVSCCNGSILKFADVVLPLLMFNNKSTSTFV